jgi:hypothetical protein
MTDLSHVYWLGGGTGGWQVDGLAALGDELAASVAESFGLTAPR